MTYADVLVIGSGIAGLSYALKMAASRPDYKVVIVTKADESESNTKYAQGGIAIVSQEQDSFESHVKDTLQAGDGLCDEEVVRMVVKEGPDRLAELVEVGVRFDRNKSGHFTTGREGGHSVNRILHHKDITGFEIERALLEKVGEAANILMLCYHFAIDLLTEHHLTKWQDVEPQNKTCFGTYVLNQLTGEIDLILSKITLLASGGAGQVYGHTTNPMIATGDGVAMAYRAKARIEHMEFVQFHPTALYNPSESPSFLISEAVRGFGARLQTRDGSFFMNKYDPRAELASRDVVAKAIDNELKISGDEFVYLDCTHLDTHEFKAKFPNIDRKCRIIGINIEKDKIPVVPAAHYFCGGVKVDMMGRTSIRNLFACGECACTGLHGANRLASNSLLEAVVFSERCYRQSIRDLDSIEIAFDFPEWDAKGTVEPKERVWISHNRRELQATMRDYVGIVRSNERLRMALDRLDLLYHETEKLYRKSSISSQLCELRNMITVGYLVITQSMERKENRGGFWNVDLASGDHQLLRSGTI